MHRGRFDRKTVLAGRSVSPSRERSAGGSCRTGRRRYGRPTLPLPPRSPSVRLASHSARWPAARYGPIPLRAHCPRIVRAVRLSHCIASTSARHRPLSARIGAVRSRRRPAAERTAGKNDGRSAFIVFSRGRAFDTDVFSREGVLDRRIFGRGPSTPTFFTARGKLSDEFS